jgi:hypothetical protein
MFPRKFILRVGGALAVIVAGSIGLPAFGVLPLATDWIREAIALA